MSFFLFSRCAGESWASYVARISVPPLPAGAEALPFMDGVGYFVAGRLVGYVSMRR